MRAAVYPFASTGEVAHNLAVISHAAEQASAEGARLLVFHECALCGYPPVETSIDAIDPDEIAAALDDAAALSLRTGLCLALGTVRFEAGARYNSVVLLDGGRALGHYDKTAL